MVVICDVTDQLADKSDGLNFLYAYCDQIEPIEFGTNKVAVMLGCMSQQIMNQLPQSIWYSSENCH